MAAPFHSDAAARARRYTIAVRGMDCAEEANALRRTVGELPGVSALDFNLLQGTMTVCCDPAAVNEAALAEAVRRAGLEVRSATGAGSPAGWWARRGRVILCGLSGVCLLAGFLAHVALHGTWLHALSGAEGVAQHVFPGSVIALYALAMLAGAWFVAPKAWQSLRHLRADMNLLMLMAVAGAAAIGQWFEAGTVSFLFAFSLLLESWSVDRARRAIRSLVALTPATARYVCPHHGDVHEKPVAEVPPGATIIVRPGERIPLDGKVTKGKTSVNQAPITGESAPVTKGPGDEVFAGTINEDGAIEFTATKPAADTALARITRMVEEAQSRRAPVEQWVEKFARHYTPAMILLAVAVALVPPLFVGNWGRWFYEALVLLVIACPCALVISTPVSIVAALTAAARAGVLIKGGAHLEAAARVRAFALDKTGTLTRGRPEVQEIVPLNGHTPEDLLARAAALESPSEHPLAAAVLRQAVALRVQPFSARDFHALKGRGVEAFLDDRPFWLGSHRLLHEKGVEDEAAHEQALRMEDVGYSVIAVGNERHLCGLIGVADGVRPEAADCVRDLKAAGVRHVAMLTGDNQGTARAVGRLAGVDEVRAELLPADKVSAIEGLAQTHGAVAMVGDGVNDAPALATATLGIAMGAAGSDAAIETADIALLADDLSRLPWLVTHARRALRIVQQNIFFALGVKAIFMTLALAQAATLWMAIAADMGASLLVIANALRLLRTEEVNGRAVDSVTRARRLPA